MCEVKNHKITNLQILSFIQGVIQSAGIELKTFEDERLKSIHFTTELDWFRAVAYKNESGVFIYNHQNNSNLPVHFYKECEFVTFQFEFVRVEVLKLVGFYKDYTYKI